jgi:hypothetical protein
MHDKHNITNFDIADAQFYELMRKSKPFRQVSTTRLFAKAKM